MASSSAVRVNMPARKIERAIHPRPATKIVSKATASNNVRAVLLVFAIAIIAFAICWRYVEIYNMSSEIGQKKSQLALLNAENSQISMTIQQKVDKSSLDSYAKNTLGMIAPKSHQYIYLDLTDKDVIVNNKKSTSTPIISKIFTNIINYFK